MTQGKLHWALKWVVFSVFSGVPIPNFPETSKRCSPFSPDFATLFSETCLQRTSKPNMFFSSREAFLFLKPKELPNNAYYFTKNGDIYHLIFHFEAQDKIFWTTH